MNNGRPPVFTTVGVFLFPVGIYHAVPAAEEIVAPLLFDKEVLYNNPTGD